MSGGLPPPGHPLRFTTLAHRGRSILGPVSSARLDGLVDRLELAAGARVLEVGCGKGELLVRLLDRWSGASAVGVDRSPWFLADARARATEAGVGERLKLVEADAGDGDVLGRAIGAGGREPGFDLAASIGAGGIFGDQAATLRRLGGLVRSGGAVLYGEGVWVADPPAGGLTAFGMSRTELPDGVAGQVALARAAGLEAIFAEAVDAGEWDDYEAAYVGEIEPWAQAATDDPDRDAFLARAAAMRASYAAWRRASMGFAIGLYRRG
jgi:SAM-dependent methyltransferase